MRTIQLINLRGPLRDPDLFTLHPQSEAFIQMPNDVVFKGLLRPAPRREAQNQVNLQEDHVLVLGPYERNLIAILVPYPNNRNPNVEGHYCFVKAENGTIFEARLEPYLNEPIPNVPNRVIVRLPIRGNPIFTGVLYRNEGFLPSWLH